MIARKAGSIVLTSSVGGLIGNPGAAHDAAAKHGVLGLMTSAGSTRCAAAARPADRPGLPLSQEA